MTELLLKFSDERGAERIVPVEGERFSIGRVPDNDLQIPNSALSRRHVEIQRFADVFVLTDCGSSNGTTLNGENVNQPVALKNDDKLTLGGAVEIAVEIVPDEVAFQNGINSNFSSVNSEGGRNAPIWKSVFLVAPIAGCFVLLFVGALLFAFSRGKTEPNNQARNFPTNSRREISKENDEEAEQTPTARRNLNEDAPASNPSAPDDSPTPANQSNELDKVEKYALLFLRGISSDTQAVLTGKQLELVNAKIKKYKSSTALRENLKAAKRSFAAIGSAAEAQNLKPEFLAVAALAKLNESRGEPLQTANAMSADLGKRGGVIGTELANDCLLVVAAYDEGGSNLAMRDKLQNLTAKIPNVSPAIVRTVWFLRDNGKLTDSAFDFVLRFLAIGAIAQNPKEFGVDAEALK